LHHFFWQTDKRVPFFVVPVEHAPHEFLEKPSDYQNMLWKATLRKWPAHCRYPYGKIHGPVGQMGEIAVETEALLVENGITWDLFSEDVLQCLPQTVRSMLL
jgi:exoribonuclease R